MAIGTMCKEYRHARWQVQSPSRIRYVRLGSIPDPHNADIEQLIRQALAMNSTHNASANAARSNASIGRSIRLLILNVLGGVPGQLDRSTLGHPGKFTFCLAEDKDDSTWIPINRRSNRGRTPLSPLPLTSRKGACSYSPNPPCCPMPTLYGTGSKRVAMSESPAMP